MNKLEILEKIEKVVGCDIDEDKFLEGKVLLRRNISSVYHITGNKFMIDGKFLEVESD